MLETIVIASCVKYDDRMNLLNMSQLIVRQRKEFAELFGFETRNKYEILNESGEVIGFCAEQQKGILGFLFRQFLGHWRSFELHFFDIERNIFLTSRHPFRFFFQEFEIINNQNQSIGSVKQRWGILVKKFDVYNSHQQVIMQMRSGLFQFWTFPFYSATQGIERAVVKKKWSGLLKEMFLDADNFMVHFNDGTLTQEERSLILAASVFTDLQYFEKKAD